MSEEIIKASPYGIALKDISDLKKENRKLEILVNNYEQIFSSMETQNRKGF